MEPPGARDSIPGVVLGIDTDANEPVILPDADRAEGVLILGGTGRGKTTLLEHLILADLRAGTPLILIDPHGDLADRVISLAPEEALERIAYLEVWPDRPFRLNLLELPDTTALSTAERRAITTRTVDNVVAVFKKLFQESPQAFAPRLERDLQMAVLTILANNGTLLDIPRVFQDKSFREKLLRKVQNRVVLEHWAWWDTLRDTEQASQAESTLNRLKSFLADETAQDIFGSTTSTVPFAEVMRGEHSLILRAPLGPGETFNRFLGSLFLTAITSHVFAREAMPEAERREVHLYIDEHQVFSTSATTELLTGGRKFRFGTTLAHQFLAQLPAVERQEAELQAASLVLFQLVPSDAELLAGRFDTTPVRTKTVMRPRMETKYKPTVTEETWDDKNTEQRYRQSVKKLTELRKNHEAVADTISQFDTALANASDSPVPTPPQTLAEFLGCDPGTLLTMKNPAIPNTEAVHALFNPSSFYFKTVIPMLDLGRFGNTDGFVASQRRIVTYAGQTYEAVCEGYHLHESAIRYTRFLDHFFDGPSSELFIPRRHGNLTRSLLHDLIKVLKDLFSKTVFWFELVPPPDMPADWETWQQFVKAVPAPGQERDYRGWTKYGRWHISPLPEAVALFHDHATKLLRTHAWGESQIRSLERTITSLETHRTITTRQDLAGYKEIKDPRRLGPGARFDTRFPPSRAVEDQWFDAVEELDQTHADRKAEITKELATLPRFTVAHRAASGAEHRITLMPPERDKFIDRDRIASIRQRSQELYGIPLSEPPQDDTPHRQERTQEENLQPRKIGRHPPGGQDPGAEDEQNGSEGSADPTMTD